MCPEVRELRETEQQAHPASAGWARRNPCEAMGSRRPELAETINADTPDIPSHGL